MLNAAIGVFNNSAHPNQLLIAELVGYKNLVQSTNSICKPFGYKDCQDLICHGFLHGTVASLNLVRPPPPPHSSNKFGHQSPLHLFDSKKTDPNSPLAALLAPLEEVMTHALANRKSLQQTQNNSRVYNIYGNGTYNYAAYTYGCECELSYYACPPLPNFAGKSENQGMIIGASIGAVIGLAFILIAVIYFMMKYKKRGQTDAHVPLEEEYEAPSNQRQLIEDNSNKSTSDPSTPTEPSAYQEHSTSAYVARNPISTAGTIN